MTYLDVLYAMAYTASFIKGSYFIWLWRLTSMGSRTPTVSQLNRSCTVAQENARSNSSLSPACACIICISHPSRQTILLAELSEEYISFLSWLTSVKDTIVLVTEVPIFAPITIGMAVLHYKREHMLVTSWKKTVFSPKLFESNSSWIANIYRSKVTL